MPHFKLKMSKFILVKSQFFFFIFFLAGVKNSDVFYQTAAYLRSVLMNVQIIIAMMNTN